MQLSDLSASGTIRMGAGAAVATIRARALEWDLPVVEAGGEIMVHLWQGQLILRQGQSDMRLSVTAPDRRLLQVIRDSVTELMEAEGIPVVWDKVDAGALAPGLMVLEKTAVWPLSPNFLRVRLTGDVAPLATGRGIHFRLLLPPRNRPPVWPMIGVTGRTVWPAGDDALHRAVYTVSGLGSEWVEFDLFVHGDSPACDWATASALGSSVGLMGPGGGTCPEADDLWLFGDQTALPAIRRMLSEATGQVRAFVFADPDDLGLLTQDARVTLSTDLLHDLHKADLPQDAFVWFAGREDQARAARKHLESQGRGKGSFACAAYWSA
ncbi:MAG: siderophore-interacting protein [Pseudotabrizicola sp.]|uniref:siderophore-interacting protein n=1 Tax=Pseudotabrizicola sp. TaxID=2939647 RepID=UPI0027288382|nr:siderophore-interacting protein [Pseudotabrizicola sp.]MDO9638346.1 siderophore-interacting protein [Pseudotabrizicola sp.]